MGTQVLERVGQLVIEGLFCRIAVDLRWRLSKIIGACASSSFSSSSDVQTWRGDAVTLEDFERVVMGLPQRLRQARRLRVCCVRRACVATHAHAPAHAPSL